MTKEQFYDRRWITYYQMARSAEMPEVAAREWATNKVRALRQTNGH